MASPGCSSLFSVLTPVRLSKIARTSNPAWKSQPIINIVGSCLSRHVLLFATRIGLSLRSQRRYVIKRGCADQSASESKDPFCRNELTGSTDHCTITRTRDPCPIQTLYVLPRLPSVDAGELSPQETTATHAPVLLGA